MSKGLESGMAAGGHLHGAISFAVDSKMKRLSFPPRWRHDVLRTLDYFQSTRADAGGVLVTRLRCVAMSMPGLTATPPFCSQLLRASAPSAS